MTDDDLLANALRRAVSTLEPPTTRLVDGAVTRGRHRRRVRRTLQAASGAVLLGAVAALALTLLPGGGSTPHRPAVVGGPAPSATRPASPHAKVLPVITPQWLLRSALATLPRPGRTTHYTGRAFFGFVGTEFIYNDGHGAAEVAVALEYGPGVETAKQFCHDTHFACERRADGSTLATHRGHERPGSAKPGAREWTADLFRTDGLHISITEWNSAQEKDAAISRPTPPFTIAQLVRWIEHTDWQPAITPAQARVASGLFTPDPPQSSVPVSPGTPATAGRMCASAAKMGSAPPPSCVKPR
jgi:hypothetical protein